MPIIGNISSHGKGSRTIQTIYNIGDTGPGGGIVIYDAGSTLSWGRYIEAATTATSPSWVDAGYAWCGDTSTAITIRTAIGTGLQNTLDAVALSATANTAVTVCNSFTGGGKSNWFLPARYEFAELWTRRTSVGGLTASSYYWTSTQHGTANVAGAWYTPLGIYDFDAKTAGDAVRAIRYFTNSSN